MSTAANAAATRMNTLFPVALSKPAEMVGFVDATHERPTPCARTLDEAFGPYSRSSTAVIVPMNSDAPMHPADRLVVVASGLACIALAVLLLVERFAS